MLNILVPPSHRRWCRPIALGRVLHRRALAFQELRVVQVMLVIVVVLHVLNVLVAQEAGLVRRAQHPRPHPVRDHHLVLLLGDPLQVSSFQSVLIIHC